MRLLQRCWGIWRLPRSVQSSTLPSLLARMPQVARGVGPGMCTGATRRARPTSSQVTVPVQHQLAVNADVLDMLRNFCLYLQRQGLLRHTLLLTVDERWVPHLAAGGGTLESCHA